MGITPEMLTADNLFRATTLGDLIELPYKNAAYKKALMSIWRCSRRGSKVRLLAAKALGYSLTS